MVDALDGSPRSASTQSAVHRIWKAFGLQPHRQDTWKLSKDPQFIEKVRDVVGLYLNPPERAVVLCVDEKSQIQALDRTAPILPMLPGVPERATHDYKRAWHLQPLRRAGPDHRQGHRPPAQPPPRDRVQAVPRHARPRGPRRARRPPRPSTTAAPTRRRRSRTGSLAHPRFVAALHPDQQQLAEPRRALVRRTDDQETPPRRAPLSPRPQRRHPRLDRDLERRPQALRLDQDRRPDPRIHRHLLHTESTNHDTRWPRSRPHGARSGRRACPRRSAPCGRRGRAGSRGRVRRRAGRPPR